MLFCRGIHNSNSSSINNNNNKTRATTLRTSSRRVTSMPVCNSRGQCDTRLSKPSAYPCPALPRPTSTPTPLPATPPTPSTDPSSAPSVSAASGVLRCSTRSFSNCTGGYKRSESVSPYLVMYHMYSVMLSKLLHAMYYNVTFVKDSNKL